MSKKHISDGKSPKANSVQATEKNIGRTLIVRVKAVEYDTFTGRALIVPADKTVVGKNSMTILFTDIMEWNVPTETATEGVK